MTLTISFAASAALCLAAPTQPKGAQTVLLIASADQHGSKVFKDASKLAQPVARWGDTHHSTQQKRLGRSAICFDGFCGSLCSVVRQGCPDDGVCVGSASDNMGICYLACGPGGECDHGLTCRTPGSLPPDVDGVCM